MNNLYEITANNLYWAYKKLKNYAYYYKSNSYLKMKIVDFEENYNESTFKRMAERLKELPSQQNIAKEIGINYLVYPKKDGISKIENGLRIDKYNCFIDMPIECFLVDILFSLDLMDVCDNYNLEYSMASRYDDRIVYSNENNEENHVIENRLLFKNYNLGYNQWKTSYYDSLFVNDKDKTIIKLDFQRCFYNIDFDFVEFIRSNFKISPKNDKVISIMYAIYCYYSNILNNIEGRTKETNHVHLPIGIFSSHIILNILMSSIDQKISSKSLSYARYADDIVLVTNASDCYDKKSFLNYFSNIFIENDNRIFIDNSIFKYGYLSINDKKVNFTHYRNGSSIKKIKNKMKKILRPSDIFNVYDEEEDLNNSGPENQPSYSYIYLQQNIKKLDSSSCDGFDAKKFINTLCDEDFINIYPYWNDIINWSIKNKQKDEIVNKIDSAIDRIKSIAIICDTYKCISTLKKELRFICDYNEGKYERFKVSSIKQEDMFQQLNDEYNKINKRSFCDSVYNEFFPIDITYNDICLFLSTKIENFDNNFFVICGELYKYHNGYETDSRINIKNDDRLIKFSKISKGIYLENKDFVNIAIANMNIPESSIIEYDLIIKDFLDPRYFDDFKTIIKNASKLNAEYILFPEFSLPYKYMCEIVKFCKRNHISIICGLTHYIDENKARNFVLVYDYNISLSILKEKNYFSYAEEEACTSQQIEYLEPNKAEYYVINNDKFKYSIMTCFESTCIKDRAILTDEIEVLFMPVYNKDTTYFSSIVTSFCRDASCFVAQANNNEYGDSRISGPYGHIKMDIVRLKGGDNNYFVIGKVKLSDLCHINNVGNNVNEKMKKLLGKQKDNMQQKYTEKSNGL